MLSPVGVVLSSAGDVFASESSNNDIRRLLSTGLAGPSPSYFPPSLFNGPKGLALNGDGSLLYIADQTNDAIEVLHLADNLLTVFASSGDGISRPVDVAVDSSDNLYVLNQGTNGNGSIEQFDRFGNLLGVVATNLAKPTAFRLKGGAEFFVAQQDGAIQHFGSGFSNTIVTIPTPGVQLQGIDLFDDGTIAVSDAGNHVIWQVSPVTNAISLLTGSIGVPGSTLGGARFARLNQPHQLARAVGNLLIAADYGNNRLVVIDRLGAVTNVLNSTNALVWYGRSGDPHGNGDPQFAPMSLPTGLVLNTAGDVFASEALFNDVRRLISTGLTAPQPPIPPPAAPTIFAVVTNYGQVSLTWSVSANATGYKVKRSSSYMGPYSTIASTTATNYTDNTVLNGTTYYYVVSATGAGGESPDSDPVTAIVPLPPVASPEIGYVDFPATSTPVAYTSVFHPVSSSIFNNDAIIVIEGAPGSQTYYTYGPTPASGSIPDPNSASASAPVGYQDGMSSSQVASYSIAQVMPDLTIKAIGEKADGSPNSDIAQARFQFIAANPFITGNNAAQFTVSDITAGAQMWDTYGTTNVPDPTNASPSLGPISSGTTLSLQFPPGQSNLVFKLIAFRANYKPSAVWVYNFNVSDYLPRIAISPNSGYYPMGQTIAVSSESSSVYYTTDGSDPTTNSLPVTMSGSMGLIKWFNSTNDLQGLRVKAINPDGLGDTTAGQPATENTIGAPADFNSAIYAGIGSQIVVPVVVNLKTNTTIQSCQFRVEVSPNGSAKPALGLSQLSPRTNDFIPLKWPILAGAPGSMTVSNYTSGGTLGLKIAALGANAMSFQDFAVVALLRIAIPFEANEGDSYSLAVSYPSATSDGQYAAVPLAAMPPTTILVTNVAYMVGDSASSLGGWYNAGGFGNGGLDNSDVNLVFNAALGIRVPYAFSDVFNAMDAYPEDAIGFVGGDGLIRFLDWNVILLRSLGFETNNWLRAWSADGNLTNMPVSLPAPAFTGGGAPPGSKSTAPWYRQALLGALSAGNALAGGTVHVPVYVKLADGAMLSGLQFRVIVTPQGAAPPLTQAPQLSLAPGVASPTLQQSFDPSDMGFGWALGSFDYLSRSSNFLGWITFTMPATAQAGETYLVSFVNVDGAPDLSTQYDFETRSAYVALGGVAPPPSICSDEWKIHFFGSLSNPLAGNLVDADGDGVPNWMEFLAGTDPTNPNSWLQLSIAITQTGDMQSQRTLHWLTAPGRAYEVQCSPNPSGGLWSTLATVSGDGTVATCADSKSTASALFYRLRVLP